MHKTKTAVPLLMVFSNLACKYWKYDDTASWQAWVVGCSWKNSEVAKEGLLGWDSSRRSQGRAVSRWRILTEEDSERWELLVGCAANFSAY